MLSVSHKGLFFLNTMIIQPVKGTIHHIISKQSLCVALQAALNKCNKIFVNVTHRWYVGRQEQLWSIKINGQVIKISFCNPGRCMTVSLCACVCECVCGECPDGCTWIQSEIYSLCDR